MKVRVIGAVAAGTSAATKIRRMQPDADLIVYEKNAYISYSGCAMPYYIGSVLDHFQQVVPQDPEFFQESKDVTIKTGYEVLKIDPEKKELLIRDPDGHDFTDSYDKLILATGAQAFVPPMDGAEGDHVFVLRHVDHMLAIDQFIKDRQPQKAVIVGSGFIGVEMADNLTKLGIAVTMVEGSPQVSGNLDADMASRVQDELEKHGVTIHLSSQAEAIGPTRVRTSDGLEIPADLVILAVGVRPNVALAQEAGIRLGDTKAIAVNDHMQTSDPDIYACGDCAETTHRILGKPVYIPLGDTANKTGRVAGENVAGGDIAFPGILGSSIYKAFDLAVGQSGLTESQAQEAGFEVVTSLTKHHSRPPAFGGAPLFVKAVADASTHRLLGVQLIGSDGVDKRTDALAMALYFGATTDDLAQVDLAYAPPYSNARDPIHYIGMVMDKAYPDS